MDHALTIQGQGLSEAAAPRERAGDVPPRPLRDVRWLMLGLPLWWAMGVEQFIYPLVLLLPLSRIILAGRPVRFVPAAQLLLLFMVCQIGSLFAVVEPVRYVTFTRNLSTYVTALMLIIIVTNSVRSVADVRYLVRGLVATAFVAATAGLAARALMGEASFASLIAPLLPAWVVAQNYGQQIAERSMVDTTWFFGGDTRRVTSFFLYATTCAVAMVVTAPMAAYVWKTSRGMARCMAAGALLVIVVAAVLTTTRVATLALLVDAVAVYFLPNDAQALFWRWTAGLAAVVVLAMVVLSSALNVPELVERFVYARGEGSPAHRALVYEETLVSFTERPALGWGTERHLPGSLSFYPAGSHSYYLGVLYRHGVLGFVVFGVLWWRIWRAARRRPKWLDAEGREAATFLRFGQWTIVVALLAAATEVLDLDASTMFLLWSVISAVLATAMLLERSDEARQRALAGQRA